MSVTQMFSRGNPSSTSNCRHASAAAPAPLVTSLTFLMSLPTTLKPIQYGRANDDRGAMLIVVKHRNLHPLAQLALDIETLGCLDVFQVDAAEGRLERCNDLDQLVGIEFVQLDVEDIDAGKFLEQHRLAFHHRLGGERTDRAQT